MNSHNRRLFRLRYGVTPGSVINLPLVDERGEVIHNATHTVISQAYLRLSTNFEHFDLLSLMGGYLVVSEKAFQVIAQFSLPVDLQRVPVDVFVNDSFQSRYSWLKSSKVFKVLDRVSSQCTELPGTDVIVGIRQWVALSPLIPPFDLFIGDMSSWIATERLKLALELEGCSNIEFAEVAVK